jgi:hypothetical protein
VRAPTRGERLVERWVRLYTIALPHHLRNDRLDEVRSDLWEDRACGSSDSTLIRRAVAGVGADMAWRWKQGVLPAWLRTSGRLAGAGIVLLLLAVFDHDVRGAETVIGTAMYVAWFLLIGLAMITAVVGGWRRFRR